MITTTFATGDALDHNIFVVVAGDGAGAAPVGIQSVGGTMTLPTK